MNRLLPTAAYAKDQPHSHTILTTHVLHRGASVGTGLGLLIGLAHSRFVSKRPVNLLGSAGKGVVYGTLVTAVLLTARMWGKEEIEWQDRTWRLLANQSQNEVDEWSFGGMVVGGVAGMASKGTKGIIGGVGIGSLVGMAGMAGWRMARGKASSVKDL